MNNNRSGRALRLALWMLLLPLLVIPSGASAQGQFAGVYLGTFSGASDNGQLGLLVRTNGSVVVMFYDGNDFVGGMNENVAINPDGSFAVTNIDGRGTSLSGSFSASSVGGTFVANDGSSGSFSAGKVSNIGPLRSAGGYYTGSVSGVGTVNGAFQFNTSGSIATVIAASGLGFAFGTASGGGLSAETGGFFNVGSDGTVSGTLLDGTSLNGTLNTSNFTANGTFSVSLFVSGVFAVHSGTWSVSRQIPLPNRAPVAVNDSYQVAANQSLVVNSTAGVLSNDNDPDGDPLSLALQTGPSNGTVALFADGGFTYTPDERFSGTDNFTYRANDGFSNSNPATVTITVKKVNILSFLSPLLLDGETNGSVPDLIVTGPGVSDTTLAVGQFFTVTATVQNQGSGNSASTTLRYFRSTNSTISTSDTQLATDAVASLVAGESLIEAATVSISTPGTFWVGACVDTVSGESNTANNCSTGVQITVQTPASPDLVVVSPSVTDTTIEVGQTVTLSATVQNQGSGSSASTTLRYFRSTNTTIDTGDTELATDPVVGLAAGVSSAENAQVVNFTAGTFWIGACVDAVTAENPTTNNCSAGVQVTVSASGTNSGAISLDGNSWIEVPDSGTSSLDVTGPFTMEAWINFTSYPNCCWNSVMAKAFGHSGAEGSYAMMFSNHEGDPTSRDTLWALFVSEVTAVEGRIANIAALPVRDGTWHHIAGVYDTIAGKTRLYFDGILVGENDKALPIQITNSPYVIGNQLGFDRRTFQGMIDEVRLWNVARTQDQIRESMNREICAGESGFAGLAGYWNFNEGSGNTVSDTSGNQNHGTFVNSPTWVETGPNLARCP